MKYTMVYFILLQVLVYSFDKLKWDAWTFNTLLILMMIKENYVTVISHLYEKI